VAPIIFEKGALLLINSARASCYRRFVSVFFFLFFLENSESEHVSEKPGIKSKKSLKAMAHKKLKRLDVSTHQTQIYNYYVTKI